MKGLTGTIKFDQHGLRTDFSLEVVELKKEGLAKVNKTLRLEFCGKFPVFRHSNCES